MQLTNQNELPLARWNAKEDKILKKQVLLQPDVKQIKWQDIADKLPGRLPKQCRERWIYQVDPNVVRNKWSQQEDIKLVELYQQFGTQWKRMSEQMPGRNDNQLKNRFHQNLKKRVLKGEFSDVAPLLAAMLEKKEEEKSVQETHSTQVTVIDEEPTEEKQSLSANTDEIKELFKVEKIFCSGKASTASQNDETFEPIMKESVEEPEEQIMKLMPMQSFVNQLQLDSFQSIDKEEPKKQSL